MMDDRLADIFDQCLERLTQGATVEQCLAAFPGERADLEPSLRMAEQLRALPCPPLPTAARVALEQTMLDSAKRRRMTQLPNQSIATVPAPQPPWRVLAPTAILVGILRTFGYRGSLVQPWIRLAALAITIVLALVLSAGALATARTLISIARPQPTAMPTSASTATPAATPIALDGQIDELAQERWVIGGRAVILSASTTISGTPALHAIAHVRGSFMPNGALLALGVTVDPLAATPSATPSAIPSAMPPTPTLEPSPTLAPTAIPTTLPAAPPAPVPQSTTPPSDDEQHTCQGQQRGRDDNKCDPKPKPEPPKPEKKDNKPKGAVKPKDK
jgi:hypothetical protein